MRHDAELPDADQRRLRRGERFQLKQISDGLLPRTAAHFGGWLEPGAHLRAQGRAKDHAQVSVRELNAAGIGRLALRHAGMGLEMDGAVQHAPQSERQSIHALCWWQMPAQSALRAVTPFMY